MEMRQAMLAHTRGIQPEREHVELTSHEEVMFDYLVRIERNTVPWSQGAPRAFTIRGRID